MIVKRLVVGPLQENTYIVGDEITKQAMVIDPGDEPDRIMDELKANSLEVSSIIFTHAHFDHAGSAGKLKELTGCQIMVHQSEASTLRKGFTRLPSGTRWKAKLLVGLGRTFARQMGKYPGAKPDLLVQETTMLDQYGFPGRVIHTPGHTHGSMIVLMEGGELIAGDTLFGIENKQHFPPFAEDLPALVNSWQQIKALPIKTIYPAHGHSFTFDSFLAEFDAAMERYGAT